MDRAGAQAWVEKVLERYWADGFGQWIAERRTHGGSSAEHAGLLHRVYRLDRDR